MCKIATGFALGMLLFSDVAADSNLRNPFASFDKRGKSIRQLSSVVRSSYQSASCGDMEDVRWDYVPRIEVTGIMTTQQIPVVAAEIEGLGRVILKRGDLIMIPPKVGGGTTRSAWIRIRSINKQNMVIELDDGSQLCRGYF